MLGRLNWWLSPFFSSSLCGCSAVRFGEQDLTFFLLVAQTCDLPSRSLSLPTTPAGSMASLIANPNTYRSQSTRPSGPFSNFQMPYVFVIPPEEEQQDTPPWCCFDADEQPENDGDLPSSPDTYFIDVPYPLQHSENDIPPPLPRSTSVHYPRPRPPMSKKLEKKQRPEAIKIIENKPQSRHRDAREDSDVIEVVKVKRYREPVTDLEENTKVKRSKTLKSRASKAFQSIKNVSKASHRTHVKDLWLPTEIGTFKGVQEQIPPQQAQTEDFLPSTPKKGSLSRGSLRSIFQSAKSSRPVANPSSLSYNNRNPSFNEVPSALTTDDALNRPVSPIPTMKKKPNTKLSVRDLHRLFFSSSSPEDPSSSPTATSAPSSSIRGNSESSTSASTLSHNYPDVPMEEDMYADVQFVDLDTPERRIASRYHQGFHIYHDDEFSPPRRLSNFSFEMKLDSLRFDALSFDPEDFDISREGNVLR